MKKFSWTAAAFVLVLTSVSVAPQPADAWMFKAIRQLLMPTRLGPEEGSMVWCIEMGDCGQVYHGIFAGIH